MRSIKNKENAQREGPTLTCERGTNDILLRVGISYFHPPTCNLPTKLLYYFTCSRRLTFHFPFSFSLSIDGLNLVVNGFFMVSQTCFQMPLSFCMV